MTKDHDLISRQAAIEAATRFRVIPGGELFEAIKRAIRRELEALPPEEPKSYSMGYQAGYVAAQRWIPCSERLPDGAYPVIVTWKNTDPASYYQYILGKHYVGVAHYKNGKWYWYSSVTEDVLMEYGRYDSEEFDEAIECIAWMPLPAPAKIEG